MTPEAVKYLKAERPGDFHDRLAQYLVNLANQSRDKMKEYYPQWKNTDASFRARALVQTANKEEVRADKKAEERSEPGKFVLPIGHSQVDTFVSFGYQMFTQRECIYELISQGAEDELSAKLAEGSLEYDLNHSVFRGALLTQYLQDIARYSFGVFKYTWDEETRVTESPQPAPTLGVDGLPQVMEPTETVEVVFQGNKIVNTSVYRFLPDPRVPIYRFQEGEFCGDEDFVNYHKLKGLEAEGDIAGLEWVQKVNNKSIESGRDFPFNPQEVYTGGKPTIDCPYILTEMQVTLCPDDFLAETKDTDSAGRALIGKGKRPVKFLFWVLNDSRVVRIERMKYPLDRYTWEVGIIGPDAENFLGLSIYDILGSLQEVADWLINSRITDIRKHIGLDLIIDESALNVSDIKQRRSIIRLNKSAQNTDVRRYVHQLSRNDTTQGNIADTETIHQYAKEGTGLTDNLTGQPASGRRSAREMSQVYSNASNRIRTAFANVWFQGLEPLGRALLANQRQGLTVSRLVKLVGVPPSGTPEAAAAAVVHYKQVSAADLAGNFDFKVFDGTLPSDRQQQAATLQEFLTAGLTNPQVFLAAQLNPQPMIEDLFTLRGIRNVNKYRLAPGQTLQLAQALGLIGNPGTPDQQQGTAGQQAQVPPGQPGPINRLAASSGSNGNSRAAVSSY